MPDQAVVISNSALMLFTGIVGGLSAAIGVLFKALLASKDQQITDGKAREAAKDAANERLLASNIRLAQAGDKALDLAASSPRERERA